MNSAEAIERQIYQLIEQYYDEVHKPKPFVPGESPVPVSGRVFDAQEMKGLTRTALEFWLTEGRAGQEFCDRFSQLLGVGQTLLTNSGSSANLAAYAALCSPKLGERALRPGDEVITVAAGFPATINPIVQNGQVPVFVDMELATSNIDASALAAARSDRTRAIILAHTLGNPFDLDAVTAFCQQHGLWLIEDCCDALGATYHDRHVGTFGDLATYSFYPAHQMTMGEGGAVVGSKTHLMKLVLSYRDWGRDCWCATGKDNTCGKRFGWQLGSLPEGYDHKYVYSHIGYNLKLTDMQAAIGVAQLDKLDAFVQTRRRNWRRLRRRLEPYQQFIMLPEPATHANPSWFGFLIHVRDDAPFSRLELTRFLNDRKIGTRLLFAGNITRQPAYQGVKYRSIGELPNTDFIMRNSFWVGVYPGISNDMLNYMADQFMAFFARY